MSLKMITSPHTKGGNSVSQVMFTVFLAMIPGIAALSYYFGWGYLINLGIAIVTALVCEAVIIKLRKRPVGFYLKDGSAIVTAALLAIALPALTPWWVTVVGSAFAIVVVKHLYGGMGQNPFNPAMAAFALLIVAFPVQITTNWASPENTLSFSQTLNVIFAEESIDGSTHATPLDDYKIQVDSYTQSEITQSFIYGDFVALGWEAANIAFLLGGIILLWRKVITWHTPVAMLASLSLLALIFGLDADSSAPAQLHLLAGGTMLGAFFIATDPVSGATSNLGKLYYGAGIGALLYIIRHWGNYPDAIAFSVLLMNFAAPFIDHYTKPRTRGHAKAHKGYQ